jgi:hypothetical protein
MMMPMSVAWMAWIGIDAEIEVETAASIEKRTESNFLGEMNNV